MHKKETKKILVVEDEVIVAEDIVQTLHSFGYEVPGFLTSGEDAILKIGELKPDLILMDIMLSGELDGIETAERINREFNIPVVYLTAYSSINILDKAKSSRPYGYIVKPFDEINLYTTIEIAIYKHEVQKDLINETENALLSIYGCIEVLLEDSGSLTQEIKDELELIRNSTNKIKKSIEKL
ncbi:MAG: response regulator [Thermodesulfobacteriota bacterium]